MLEQLKTTWNESPWYIKLGIPFVAIFLLLMKGKDIFGAVLEAAKRTKVDQAGKRLEDSENAAKADASRLAADIDALEKKKAEALKKAETDESTDFHNNR